MSNRRGILAALAALGAKLGLGPKEEEAAMAALSPRLLSDAPQRYRKRRKGTAAKHRRAIRKRQRARGWTGPLLMVPCPGAPTFFKPGDTRAKRQAKPVELARAA